MQEQEIGMMGEEELRECYGWMLDEEFASLLERRAATYGFIARFYRVEVDQAFLDELCAARWPLSTGNEKVDAGNRMLATYLSGVWENTLTELAVDYVRVFVGHSTDIGTAAFPYESVYTSEKHLLMQDARDEVLAIYRSMGLDKDESWKESEDHLALELEFQRVVALRSAEALKAGDLRAALALLETQRNFFQDHLLPWVPAMTKDLRRFAKTDFYRGVAYLTDGFFELERAFFEDVFSGSGNDAGEVARVPEAE